MNKKTIITILLAIVAMVGQAQIKSGLNLCLRDEMTGQWLIGLFDGYAIYNCDYWEYAEVGKDRVVLTKDGLRKDIQLKGQLHPSCLCPYNKNGGGFCLLHPSSV